MLRGQYGTATPSSLAPVAHREDAQPNEGLKKQFHKLPPSIRSTAAPSRGTNTYYRGSRGRGNYSGGNMSRGRYSQRGPQLQYAIRGNPAWRGQGISSSRGSYGNWNAEHTTISSNNDASSPSASSSSGRTPSVGVRPSSPPRNEMDPGPSHRRTYSTAFPDTSHTSATPLTVESSQDTWWMHRSRSPTPKLPAAPLKRLKRDGQPEIKPQATISRLPLPGRLPKPVQPIKQKPVPMKQEPVSVKQEPIVKQEPLSPSPPPRAIASERKLITESRQFYPFPESCKKSDPNHKQNRKSFFVEKYKELVRLGLKKTRAFARDDGLVIEWTSSIPVWSDTLQPEVVNLATVIQRAYQINTSLTQTSASVRRKKRAASHRSDSVPGPSRSQGQDATPVKPRPTSTTTKSLPTLMAVKSQPTPMATKSQPTPTPVKSRPTSTAVELSSRPTEVSNPPRNVPPIPRRRLPLPGRQSVESKPITVPVAFAPRRSTTPSSISSSTTTLVNKMNTVSPVNLPPRESTPTVAIANQPKISSSFLPSEPTYSGSQDSAEHHRAQKPHSNDGLSDHLHQSVLTIAFSPLLNPTIGASGAVIAHKPTDDEHHEKEDDECEEAEDVAISLLTPGRDNMGSDDEAEMDVSTDDDGANEIEGLVADFLQRYCQLFDSDRSKLAAAYDKDALFSCCVHHLDAEQPSSSMAGLFAPEVNSTFCPSPLTSMVNRGRTEINDRLLSVGPYQFCPRGVTGNLIYDAVDSPAGILLTVHGEIVNAHVSDPHMDHVLTLDQSFVLRKRGVNVYENDDDGPERYKESDWPLVAISHQMTVRAAPLLSTERLGECSPWIRGIIRS